jgi:hypothetical protein
VRKTRLETRGCIAVVGDTGAGVVQPTLG